MTLVFEVHSTKSHHEMSCCGDVGLWRHNPLLSTVLPLVVEELCVEEIEWR